MCILSVVLPVTHAAVADVWLSQMLTPLALCCRLRLGANNMFNHS